MRPEPVPLAPVGEKAPDGLGKGLRIAPGGEQAGLAVPHDARNAAECPGDDGAPEGSVRGSIIGTHWHGLLVADGFRKAFLRSVADRAGRDFIADETASFVRLQEERFDAAADLIDEHVDVDALVELSQARPTPRSVLTVSMESYAR